MLANVSLLTKYSISIHPYPNKLRTNLSTGTSENAFTIKRYISAFYGESNTKKAS